MKANKENLIDQLNKLVEINNDRIQGYEKARKETQELDLQTLFENLASHSRNYKSELANEIILLGGEPTTGTSTSGKIFRLWMEVKAALSRKDRKAILSSCETGEDAALETYDDVLKSEVSFPENVRTIILNQKQEIEQDHDRVKALRDAAHVSS